MNIDALFFDAHHPSDIEMAVQHGDSVSTILDDVFLKIAPQIVSFVGGLLQVYIIYGPRVFLISTLGMLLFSVNMARSLPVYMRVVDKSKVTDLRMGRQFGDGLRQWNTVARHNQAKHETRTYSGKTATSTQQYTMTHYS
jgi:ABC-type transport system involved in Fe-S cluster assembly fused permease/ATPase subunit